MNKVLAAFSMILFSLSPQLAMSNSCASLNGQDDKKFREYALRYTTSIIDEIRVDIKHVSDKIFGRSADFKIDFKPSKRCVATPYVQGETIRVAPIFLELLMLKAEDTAIVEHMIFAQVAPNILTLSEDELMQRMVCAAHVLNYDHVRKPGNIAELCGPAKKYFFEAFSHVRKDAQTWSVATDFFYDTLYMSLAHEYAHIFLKHDRSTLVVEDEINADVMAVQIFSQGKPSLSDVMELKSAFGTSAALLDFDGLLESNDPQASETIGSSLGKVTPEIENYLSSECRGYEVFKRLGLHETASSDFKEIGQLMAKLIPPHLVNEFASLGLFQNDVLLNCK